MLDLATYNHLLDLATRGPRDELIEAILALYGRVARDPIPFRHMAKDETGADWWQLGDRTLVSTNPSIRHLHTLVSSPRPCLLEGAAISTNARSAYGKLLNAAKTIGKLNQELGAALRAGLHQRGGYATWTAEYGHPKIRTE